MITFHQAKGLEFDHVYVTATGRDPDISPALRTGLFSGKAIPYTIIGNLGTKDTQTLALSLADREREVYVAITRARLSLTIMHDPALADKGFYALNPAIDQVFAAIKGKPHETVASVLVKEFTNA